MEFFFPVNFSDYFLWFLYDDFSRITSLYTAISEKVVGKSVRDNPERYGAWFWVHCSSEKFAQIFSLSASFLFWAQLMPIFWLKNNYNVPVARCLYFSLLIVLHQLMYHYSRENSAREQRIDISFQNSITKIKKGLHVNVAPIIWARQARLTEMTFSRTLTSNLKEETFFNSVDFGILEKDSAWIKIFVARCMLLGYSFDHRPNSRARLV